jgi:hypothetical protein
MQDFDLSPQGTTFIGQKIVVVWSLAIHRYDFFLGQTKEIYEFLQEEIL